MHLCPLSAGVALDVAAPQELAVALPNVGVLVGVVSPAAAHQVATVGLQGRLVAQAPLRPHAASQLVGLAVVGRSLDVDQLRVFRLVVGVGSLDLEESGTLVAAGPNRLHVNRLVVLVFQEVSQLPELGKCHPASLGGAGPRNAVALALQTHSLLQDLQHRPQGHENNMLLHRK